MFGALNYMLNRKTRSPEPQTLETLMPEEGCLGIGGLLHHKMETLRTHDVKVLRVADPEATIV